MNIQKILQDKQNNLQQSVNGYQALQQKLNDLNKEILETSGAIKQLQELQNLENKKEEDKNQGNTDDKVDKISG